MIKNKFSNIAKIEMISHFYVTDTPVAVDGNSVSISLVLGKTFTNVPFSVGSGNLVISEKDKTINSELTFTIPGLIIDNVSVYNLALYNKFLVLVTLHDGTVIALGNKNNFASFSYNYDNASAKYNISVNWQYHRHPLFVL